MCFSQRQEQELARALSLVLCAAAVLLIGCSDDCKKCPICVEPESCSNELYDGRLYVTMAFGNTGLFVFDLKTEQLIDSVMYFSSMGEVDVTPDGSYIAVNGIGEVLIYNALDMSLANRISHFALTTFIEGGTALMGSYKLRSYRYSFPECQQEWSADILEWVDYKYSDERNEFYGVARWDTVFCYSFETNSIRQRWLIPPDSGGYGIYCIDVNKAGTLLYGLAAGFHGPECFIFDLVGDSIISSFPLYAYFGVVKLHPDEQEIYVSDPGLHVPAFTPGTIYVLDAHTGEYLQGISLWGYYDDLPYLALDAWNMQFSPDGNHLFVQTGNINRELGTVLRIDTKTKKVESLLFPEIDRLPEGLAVGPKP